MTATAENSQAFYAAPSLRQRFWRKMGFRYHMGNEPEGTDALPGWMKNITHLHFSWSDRLRLLISGKLYVSIVTAFDTPSPDKILTRMDWRILDPGEKRR